MRTVSAPTTVTWRNGDGVTHTVTNDPGSGEVFNLSLGNRGLVTHTFNTPGTYTYHCTIHGLPGSGMHGTIVVQ
ncbi:MAG: cupredoxin domain-containing protein [Gemmatimonadales bacterium]